MNSKQALRLLLSLALAAIVMTGLSLVFSVESEAQGIDDQIYLHKELGRASPVVYVGEYLTFTIHIRNDTPFTVTQLPMTDNYRETVLGFADARPVAPDVVNAANGTLEWNDLTTHFGDLAPGQEIWLTVGFIAEHPETAIVNEAFVHDALGSGGAFSDTNSTITETEAVGGSAPVDKILVGDLLPQAGMPLTFTIVITNNGYVTLTVVPLVDTYTPTVMTFSYASPPPDQVDLPRGVLTWTDVTSWTGDIPPHGVITVTTVFTALTDADEAINHAEVLAGEDWYGNDVGGGADEAPITIIPRPTEEPTPAPTPTPRPPSPSTPQPTPPPTPVPPTPIPTPTPFTPLLPATGERSEPPWTTYGVLLAAIVLIAAGGWQWARARR